MRSEPIVCTPDDAYRCFLMTDLDVLVLGRHVLRKEDQRRRASAEVRSRHLAQFALD